MLLGVLMLYGCGSSLSHGSFLQGRPRVEAAMAADAARKLAEVYDPAERSLWLPGERSDALGRSLSAELRKAGFKVRSGETEQVERDLPVRYVADVLKGTELCRITLSVGRRSFSRAYSERGSAIYPAGPWSVGAPVGASVEASVGGR
jgi:hypothetical protein